MTPSTAHARQFAILLAPLISFTITNENCLAQTAKKASESPAEKAVAKYQVDFRIQISSELDKQRVVIWTNLLKELGAAGVSQVPGEPALPKEGEKADPAIQPAGPRRVVVQAAIGPSGNLFIGSDGYRVADRERLVALIKKLQTEGVPGPDPASPMWGLGKAQFELLQAELKQPPNFDLDDKQFELFLNELRGRTKLTIKVSPEAQGIAKSIRLNSSTGSVSLGAALAYVLGQHGLAFEPRGTGTGDVFLLLMPLVDSKRPWPVGLTPDQFPGNIAPQLMATARYQTNSIPLAEVLAIFSRELKMDVLLDRASLIKNNIDADKLRSTVQVPGGTFQSAIKKTLGPLSLKHELRIDEANLPFLWITYSQPTGPVKKKP